MHKQMVYVCVYAHVCVHVYVRMRVCFVCTSSRHFKQFAIQVNSLN